MSREGYAALGSQTTKLTYAAMEMVLEEPERDAEHIGTEAARMVINYYAALREGHAFSAALCKPADAQS